MAPMPAAAAQLVTVRERTREAALAAARRIFRVCAGFL
jgi:hypothetical protein